MFNRFIQVAESVTPSSVKVSIAVLSLAAIAIALHPAPNDPIKGAVKITGLYGRSGGSGVILNSSRTKSTILTNAHVCGLIKGGGLVHSSDGTNFITGYKESANYDLCLVQVNSDLQVSTRVAKSKPVPYYEKATVSGHPALLPTTVTSGHVSGSEIISVVVGYKKCTGQLNPEESFMCAIFGVAPIIRSYESTLVTATIQPGSSGSGVYNQRDELIGLVFAGSGQFGYAWTMPYSSLISFLDESEAQPLVQVGAGSSSSDPEDTDQAFARRTVKARCDSLRNPGMRPRVCDMLSRDTLFVEN